MTSAAARAESVGMERTGETPTRDPMRTRHEEHGDLRLLSTSERHAIWKRENLAYLRGHGAEFTDRGETLLFRRPGKPAVDFYPSTGRWKVVSGPRNGTVLRGGAMRFLSWYEKQ